MDRGPGLPVSQGRSGARPITRSGAGTTIIPAEYRIVSGNYESGTNNIRESGNATGYQAGNQGNGELRRFQGP